MKKQILLLLIFFVVAKSFGQSNFTKGFDKGYKKGYCHNQGIGCIEPISPIAPIPKIGESNDNYNDGYNRGFEMGLYKWKLNSSSKSSDRARYKTPKATFVDNTISSNTSTINLQIKTFEKIEKRIINNLKNENYQSVIDDANTMININSTYANAYFFKSNAQYHLGQKINAYNNSYKSVKCYSRSGNRGWRDFMHKKMDEHLSLLMSNNQYSDVIYVTKQFWYKTNLGYYYQALGYYYKKDYKKAKKYFRKIKDNKSAKEYLTSIDNKKHLSNPFISNIIKKKRVSTIVDPLASKANEVKQKENLNSNKSRADIVRRAWDLSRKKEFKKSLALLDNYIGNNESHSLYATRGLINYYAKNYKQAILDITKSAKSNKEIPPNFIFYRAMSKSEIGDLYGAINDYDFLINLETTEAIGYDIATVYNNKAYSYVGLKRYKEALSFVNKALDLDTEKWYIWDTRAEIYLNLNEYNKAIKDASKGIEIHQSPGTYFIRGLAHVKSNNKELGCMDLSRAGELGKTEAYEEIKKYCK